MTDVATANQPSVFLCHNSQDKPLVRRLADRLKANQVRPWVDECDLDGGCRWQKEIVDGMLHASAVVVCLGQHGTGRWQEHEIEIVVQERIEARKVVIPFILPTADEKLEIPRWLRTAQLLDLRQNETDLDPFSRLLKSIDGRDPSGHHRPSVTVLYSKDEPSSADALKKVISECGNALQRVRVIDHSETLLSETLSKCLKHTDVLVSLLAPDSFDSIPVDPFSKGRAHGAQLLAMNLGVRVVQWRSDTMSLPNDQQLAKRFTTTDIETYLPTTLAKVVSTEAENHFTRRRMQQAALLEEVGTRRALLGYPLNGKKFVNQVRVGMEKNAIECDSPPKWDLLLSLLQQEPQLYEALVVVLTGDDEWLCDCAHAFRKLQAFDRALPRVRAYLHKADDKDEADPPPIKLKGFEEYFGLNDVPKLAKKIVATEGAAL